MIPSLRLVPPVLSLACLMSAAQAQGRDPAIHDEAGLFRPDTVSRAEQQIEDVRRTFDRNLLVQTVKAAPVEQRRWFHFRWRREVNRALEAEAQKRAEASGTEGIFVVICNDPRDVHVVVRPADDPAFTPHDAEVLRRTIVWRLRDAGPDAALLALVGRVHDVLQANVTRGQSSSLAGDLVLAGLLGGGVALWLLLCLVRYKMRAAHVLPAAEGDASAPRRAPALLGAMFGTPAGLWLYDKLHPGPARIPAVATEAPAAAPSEGVAAEKGLAETPPLDESPEDAPVSP